MIKKGGYSALIIVLCFLAGFSLHRSGLITPRLETTAPTLKPGLPRPYFEMLDIDGNRRAIDEWHGRVIVLNFWASWCAPCLKEIPVFVALQDHYQNSGLQFIGVSPQEADAVRSYAEKTKINYPLLAGAEAMQTARLYGNSKAILPYTVIIDRAGNIAFWKQGPLSKTATEQAILPLL